MSSEENPARGLRWALKLGEDGLSLNIGSRDDSSLYYLGESRITHTINNQKCFNTNDVEVDKIHPWPNVSNSKV